MIIRVAVSGLLCLFTACSVAPRPSAQAPDSDRTFDPTNNSSAPNRRALSSPFDLGSPRQQHSPSALFLKDHGEFMLAREAWRPDARASVKLLTDTEVKGEPGDFNLQHSKFDIERRLHLPHPDTFLDFSLDYENRQYEFSNGAVGAHDETLHRASATVRYGQFIDQDTLVEIDGTAGVWSDFSDSTLHHEDWQFFSRGLMTWRYAKDVFLMGGVEYSSVFREFDVYPLLGVAWTIDPHWRVDVLLPRQARLTYSQDEHTSLFLSFDIDGGEYAIHAPRPGFTQRTINVQEFEVSLGGLHRMNANFSVHGRVGMLMGGDYRFFSNGPADYDGQLEPQIFLDVGIGWTF